MKTKGLFILLLFYISILQAQREAGIWYFGNEAGLDFNSGSPVALTNGKLITNEGCSTISDFNGNLLFYTDGTRVLDSNHNIMVNGNGLLGHKSSTQSAIIVPNPSNNDVYYIFTVDQPNDKNGDSNLYNNVGDFSNDGLNYSEVNMSLNGGLGAVTSKNSHLVTYNQNNSTEVGFKTSEKITSVQSADGLFYWVITHFKDKFYAFKVTNSGVQPNPIISSTSLLIPTGGYIPNAIGYLKASPNGKKIAIVHTSSRTTNDLGPKGNIVRNTGKVLLYDFNNLTGKVSNSLQLLSSTNPYGIEFSSKSKKLYVTTNNSNTDGIILSSTLFQFNLESNNIVLSKKEIITNDYVAGALQLAIDEKIYRSGYRIGPLGSDGWESISVINNPEADGTACNFKLNEVNLNGKYVFLGLPPFIQSLFLFNFKYEFTCFGDATHFFISTFETIDSVVWDFGDGTTSTDMYAYHTYDAPGTYTVSVTKMVNGETKDPLIKEITIKEIPIILNTTFNLVQCDSYDTNPNDGLATFNLENSNNALTLNQEENFNVYFYLNDLDAENDTYNENSLSVIYTNTSENQIITAKVIYKDSDCFSLSKIKLTAIVSVLLPTSNMIGCDIGDGTAEFDLASKELEIINTHNLPNSISILFFDSEENAINNFSPLDNTYISIGREMFFIAENNGVCYGSGEFNLEISYFPPIDLVETIYVCENTFPININATIPTTIQQDYSYTWSSGENTHEILIFNEQTISVTIIDKISLCKKVKTFEIIRVTTPIIINVDINDNDKLIKIITANNFDNLYSIDNPYDFYQSENTFSNIEPGTHTIYVKNKYNCGVSIKKIFVLGFPKFFTPNNDGINDIWAIKGLNFYEYKYSNISIFDRFGKHLATIKPNSGWDGFYNGKFIPSTDYWFSIDATDNENITKTYKGHFSLIRR